MRRFLIVPAVLAVLALPASANAVTFGSDLSAHTANSGYACGDFNVFQYAGRVGCSAFSTSNASNPADSSESDIIPFPDPRANGDQHGTITQVTFKTAPGAPAGPARLSVIEFVRDANSTADPALVQDEADSATFTMAPGSDGLVHVATNLPARSLYNAGDNSYRFDTLVVSMLDNSTPIPADLNSPYLSAWISPYVDIASSGGDLTTPLPANRQGTGCCGFGPNPFYAEGAWYQYGVVLMQADLTIDNKQNGATNGLVTFGKGRLAHGAATLPVTCQLDTTCAGLLQLLNATQAAAAKKRVRPYGSARFSIPAHATAKVKVRLSKAGKRLLRRKSVQVIAAATIGSQVTRSTVTLSH